MKPARIYKTKLRQNILRQMIFTDRNILICLLVAIGLGVYFGVPWISTANRILLTILISGLVITGASYKVDGQKAVSLLPRLLHYIFTKKNTRL